MENLNNEEKGNISEDSSAVDENKFVYKNVIKNKQNSRLYSVISVVFSGLSVLFCFFPWLGLIFGCLGILFAIISRKNIGYFDKISIAGIIIGIFGAVFAFMGIMFIYVFENNIYENFFDMFKSEKNSPLINNSRNL